MSGKTVSVGCKLPHGIHADVGDVRVTLNGSNSSNVIGGYGVTNNVDAEHIERWMADHKDAPYIQNELIFVVGNEASARDAALEREAQRTGFEGLNPDAPAPGVEPVNKDELKKQKNEAAEKTAKGSKADSNGQKTKAPKA